MDDYKLILASGSPRRKELLSTLRIPFEIRVIETDESFPESMSTEKVAKHIALQKALAQKELLKDNDILIAADTVVAKDNVIYGKPTSKQNAIEMLTHFSNDSHFVYTGVCIMSKQQKKLFTVKSEVRFSNISTQDASFYFETENPSDKAGAYGIQDNFGMEKVEWIKGSYTNIMGFPVPQVYKNLMTFIKDL